MTFVTIEKVQVFKFKYESTRERERERERERARGQERERDEKGKMEKVCKCNSLPPGGRNISHPPTKVNFRELLI
jgi:hypothetical protein